MANEPNHPYAVLDVFTNTPLQGNQLAVFTEAEEIPSRLMQATAREINYSETVFLLPGDEGADAQLRIFTPTQELPFAGHPVLGAAFVVAERDDLHAVRLRTGAGVVPVHLRRDADQDPDGDYGHEDFSYGEMEQPLPTIQRCADPGPVLAALGGIEPELPVDAYTNGPEHLMIAVASREQVASLAPDLTALAAAHGGGVCVFTVTAAGAVHARVFVPGLNVPEDPATGSAAGPLVLHLLRYGLHLWGAPVTITQGVELGRPSTLHARVEGSGSERDGDVRVDRILVGGGAVRVAEGHFRLQ